LCAGYRTFGCGLLVRNLQNFSDQQSALPTHVGIFHQDRGHTLYLTGVMDGTFQCFVYMVFPGSSFLMITPPLVLGLEK